MFLLVNHVGRQNELDCYVCQKANRELCQGLYISIPTVHLETEKITTGCVSRTTGFTKWLKYTKFDLSRWQFGP